MVPFTIFHNVNSGSYAAVYDSQLPTQTGIGEKPEWRPVFRGEATGLLDKARQCKEFQRKAEKLHDLERFTD